MLNFLKYILHQDKISLVSGFFWAQCMKPTRGKWVSNIKKILDKIYLQISFEEVKNNEKIQFKKTVEPKVRKAAPNKLLFNIFF